MKIAIYGIAKNEERNVAQWVETSTDADVRFVLDTGSTDQTVERLRALGVQVESQLFDPFRFDRARNAALKRLPSDIDICLSLDFDEVLTPGWRAALERNWRAGVTEIKCRVDFDWDPEGKTRNLVWLTRAHSRKGYYWKGPVHELLDSREARHVVRCDEFEIRQIRDRTKDRSYYTDLQILNIKENPADARLVFCLATDLFDAGELNQAFQKFEEYLNMPVDSVSDRSKAYVMMALISARIQQPDEQILRYLYKAIGETPERREPWVHLASAMASAQDWPTCFAASMNALRRPMPGNEFSEPDPFFESEPQRLLELSIAQLGIR